MIGEFTFKNFFSFKDEATLSMIPGKNIKRNELENNFFRVNSKDLLLKTSIIYGANASGKSTILRAVYFLKMMVLNSHVFKPKETFDSLNFPPAMRMIPFLLNKESRTEPTELSISFVNEGIQYKYSVVLNINKILKEKLLGYYSGKPTILISREGTNFKFDSIYFKNAKKIESEIRENQLALSVCADRNIEEALNIYDYFKKVHVFVDGIVSDFDTVNMLKSDVTGEFKIFLLNLLRNADSSIQNVLHKTDKIRFGDMTENDRERIKKTGLNIPDDMIFDNDVYAWIHGVGNGEDAIFPLEYESMGTKIIFELAGTIYNVMKKNMVFLWDEFDRSLHPDLTKYIIKVIHSSDSGGQFIFNTHDTSLLNIRQLFRRDQIRFVEKNRYGESQLYSLLEFRDRAKSNIEKNYLNGRYGGIPSISNVDLFGGIK